MKSRRANSGFPGEVEPTAPGFCQNNANANKCPTFAKQVVRLKVQIQFCPKVSPEIAKDCFQDDVHRGPVFPPAVNVVI